MDNNTYIMTKDGELYHYGVLGMKWGIRKARNQGSTYTYKSHGQRKWEKKLNKATSNGSDSKKIDKATRKLSMYKERDKSRQSYVESTTAGKTVVRQLLLGPFGSGAYSRMRAAGYGRLSSGVVSYFATPVEPILTKILENSSARDRLNNVDNR